MLAVPGETGDAPPPDWLLPHQATALARLRPTLRTFGGAILADAVGLGKTFVALALARDYPRVLVAAPAHLCHQWRDEARTRSIDITTVSHAHLSRGATLPRVDLLIVDEAHRFRNPGTRRYDTLVRTVRGAHVLLVTATPLVNGPGDLLNLLRIFLPDSALGYLGYASLEALRLQPTPASTPVAPLIIARSGATIPTPSVASRPSAVDHPAVAVAPLTTAHLIPVLAAIDRLRFPAFDTDSAASLLRQHLIHRLASSVAAARQTLQRHRAYLQRALQHARHGRDLPRREARRIFGPDDLAQGELFSLLHPAPPGRRRNRVPRAHVRNLEHDLRTVDRLLTRLRRVPPGPRLRAIRRLLDHSPARKTIVFTGATATAAALAAHLGWFRLGVATAGGGRIASGPVTLDELLDLFAPTARNCRHPAAAVTVTTLIATDVVSEGVNLQDADRIVHYDIPWTPLRLQQRLGRVVRLGSCHRTVDVHWFVPPPAIESRLDLEHRIALKSTWQDRIGSATTCRVGIAVLDDTVLEKRERLLRLGVPAANGPAHAWVRGPAIAAFGLIWKETSAGATEGVPEVVLMPAATMEPVTDLGEVLAGLQTLVDAPEAAEAGRVEPYLQALRVTIRDRLRRHQLPCAGRDARYLATGVLRLARAAGRGRCRPALEAFDRILRALTGGVPEGGLRTLHDTLTPVGVSNATAGQSALPDPGLLSRWLDDWEPGPTPSITVELVTAVFGDGSR